jgi:hypothetical protein
MKPSFAISSAVNESARIQPSQTGETAKNVRVRLRSGLHYQEDSPVDSTVPWQSTSKIAPHIPSARSAITLAVLDLVYR